MWHRLHPVESQLASLGKSQVLTLTYKTVSTRLGLTATHDTEEIVEEIRLLPQSISRFKYLTCAGKTAIVKTRQRVNCLT
jgi:hypothetical protein